MISETMYYNKMFFYPGAIIEFFYLKKSNGDQVDDWDIENILTKTNSLLFIKRIPPRHRAFANIDHIITEIIKTNDTSFMVPMFILLGPLT